MHYTLSILVGLALTAIGATFLSSSGAFLILLILTGGLTIVANSGISDRAVSFMGIIWATISVGFIVCAFFVWGVAGDLSWMLKQ